MPKKAFTEDFTWFLNSSEAQEPYKGEFVAILDGKVVAAKHTFAEAALEARKTARDRKAMIAFLPQDEVLEV